MEPFYPGHHRGRRLEEAASTQVVASQARKRANDAFGEIAEVSRRLDKLALACQAMWELIRENTAITDADIEAKIREVDLRDGVRDSKVRASVYQCPSCGNNVASNKVNCDFCGQPVSAPDVFG